MIYIHWNNQIITILQTFVNFSKCLVKKKSPSYEIRGVVFEKKYTDKRHSYAIIGHLIINRI